MTGAKAGDTVRVHYTGSLNDGSIFDSSAKREPLEFTLGEGTVIPGFEQAVTGMSPGDERRVQIPAAEAYGERRAELVVQVARTQFPDEMEPEVGQQLQMTHPGGVAVVTVLDADDESVTLDANHPLAGQDLHFELKLVEIA
jgi:peptidylprolyl isomerase